jgi:hypothetical protein
MLVGGILKGMNDKDLDQRYGQSYALYNGKVVWIRAFSSPYILLTDNQGKEYIEAFKFELLDTARPRSRWVVYNRGKLGMRYSAHISYPPKRQYRRGLCSENIICKFVDRSFNGFSLFEALFTQGFEPPNTTRLALGEEGIFKDQILVRKEANAPGTFHVYFRTRQIASYCIPLKHCILFYPRFKQELEEAVVGIAEYEFKLQPAKMQAPDLMRYPPLRMRENDEVQMARLYEEYVARYMVAKRKYEKSMLALGLEVRYE